MDEPKPKESLPRDQVRKRLKLITPVGSSYLPLLPKLIVLPRDFPPCYPESLMLRTEVIFGEAVKEFSDRSKLEPFCQEIVSRLTELMCEAVREGILKGHAARYCVEQYVHYVCIENCDNEDERNRIEEAVRISDERAALSIRLADCEKIQTDSSKSRAAHWGQIEINFTSDERLQISISNKLETCNFGDFGLEDHRTGKPNGAWTTLRELAEKGGSLDFAEISAQDQTIVEKRIQKLRAVLRRKFGMMTDPIPCDRGLGYRTAFKIGTRPSIDT